MDTNPAAQPVTLGKIASPFGVKGWTKVTSYTTPAERMLDYKVWQIVQNGVSRNFTMLEGRLHGKFLAVKFDGIDDRDEVARLTNGSVVVSRESLSELDDGDYYWVDLIGLSVATTEGVALGKVERMMETGANDVLVVNGDRERLIPWILDDVVKSVDLAAGQMTVDWDHDF